MQSNLEILELKKRLSIIESKIESQDKAIKRQQMESCQAMVEELKDAAINQGYDIIEEKNENGIQLQFVRREY